MKVATSEAVTANATQVGTVMGTLRYMAPEQRRGDPVEGGADIFALGIVLYELITRQHPFAADTPFGVLDTIVSHPVIPPSRLRPGIPAALDALLLQMLETDPRRRPAASDVDELLAQLVGESAGRPGSRVTTLPRRRRVGRERERAALRAGFDSAAAGNGLLMCVAGEPGIGKTTLVEDFLDELDAEGFSRIVRGRCSERLAGAEAYLPWLEALEDVLRGAWAAEMTRLMRLLAPSWYEQLVPADRDDVITPLQARAASQERMKRELGAFFQEVARVRPLVLFLDDVHWSDVSTVDLLTYVGTRLATKGPGADGGTHIIL